MPTADHYLLEGLNPVQREAVVHEGGPLLIVAVFIYTFVIRTHGRLC